MFERTVSGITLTLLLIGMLTLAFNIQSVKASGTIYIRADGSVDPDTAPISTVDNVTYTLNANINDSIVVERSNIIIDGKGYTLEGSGRGISLTSINNVTILGTNIRGFSTGIYLLGSLNNSISGNNVTNNNLGIWLDYFSNNNTISQNTVANNDYGGIYLKGSSNNTLSGNIASSNGDYYYGFDLQNSSGNIVVGNIAFNNKIGINIVDSSNNTIVRNTFTNNMWGSQLYNSSRNRAIENMVSNNSQYGIYIRYSSNNTIVGNTYINNSIYGIWLYESSNNTLYHNHFINNTEQILLGAISKNSWDNGYPSGGNYWSDYAGVDLYNGPYQNETGSDGIGDSAYVIDANKTDNYPLVQPYHGPVRNLNTGWSYLTIQRAINNASEGDKILALSGIYYENVAVNKTINLIGEDANTTIIDGKGIGSVVYVSADLVNISGFTIQNSGGGIYLSDSSNNRISGNRIARNEVGIALENSSNTMILANHISNNKYGIIFNLSRENTVSANNISNNTRCGVGFAKSFNNTVSKNIITNSSEWFALGFGQSSNNTVSANNVTNNFCSVYLDSSSNNKFYNNNFIENTMGVATNSINTWNNSYPSGGNYWSDYNGTDMYNGASQNQTGSDGIGDTPHIIDENNTDWYPLMGPFGPLTMAGENVTVFPTDDACLIFENVASEGLTTVNKTETGPEPPSGFMVDQYYRIETSANYSGKITIRIIYDDSNMTQEQEENLQLMQWNETAQEWMDITTYIDMENNVIIGETSHLSMFGVTKLELVNYITITEVTPSKTIVGEDYSVTINVTIANQGDMPQTFNITVYANANAIDSKNVTLASGNYTTITFTWNTTGFAKGKYTVSAYALPVPGETATADNTKYASQEVCVTIPGDVEGDFDVDLFDAVKLLFRYGYKEGDLYYDPNCDINCNGKIYLYDAVILLTHYGQKDP